MASSLSWILRSSSVPVLRQSARRRRREEARSWQRSRVSSAGKGQDLVSSPSHSFSPQTPTERPPSARQSCQDSWCSPSRSTSVTQALMSWALDLRGKAGRNEGEKRMERRQAPSTTRLTGHWCWAHPGGSAGHSCAAPGSPSAALPRPCTPCPGCRNCRHRRRPAPGEPRHLHVSCPLLGSSIQAHSAPRPAHPSPSCLPLCYNLSSLLEGPAGILQEGEGFGRRHLMDGRGLVPQVDSELLHEARAVIALEVCTQGSPPGLPRSHAAH